VEKNGEFVVKNGEFVEKIGEFMEKNGEFVEKIGEFVVKNGEFLEKIGDFMEKNSHFSKKNPKPQRVNETTAHHQHPQITQIRQPNHSQSETSVTEPTLRPSVCTRSENIYRFLFWQRRIPINSRHLSLAPTEASVRKRNEIRLNTFIIVVSKCFSLKVAK
jgi:phage FluMu protein Com